MFSNVYARAHFELKGTDFFSVSTVSMPVMYGRTYNRTRRARDIRRRAERTARAGDGHEEAQESVTSRG